MLSFSLCRAVRLDCAAFYLEEEPLKEAKIKVLALLPLEPPKVVELENTLEAMQKFVGGNIECLPLCDLNSEFTLVCNDEGKLLELPPNRMLWDGADYLAGSGFIAGTDFDGNMISLTAEEIAYYTEKYRAFLIAL